MATGHVSDIYQNSKITDFNLSNSSVFSTKSYDDEDAITPHTQPVSPDKSKEKDDDDEKTRSRKKVRYMESARFITASVFMTVAIVALVVVTLEYEKAPDPKTSTSSVDFQCVLISTDTTATTKLKFNTTIEIWCDYSETIASDIYNSTLLVEFKPEYYLLQTQNTMEINHSETSAVQLEVGQSEADGQYQITCSSTSDCTPAQITLLGSFGNKVVPLYGVNFTCIIKYNDYDGWSVGCTGSIPKSVVSSIDEITCRPIIQNQIEADKTEAKVSKDVLLCNNDETCNFQCPIQNQDRYYSDPKFCNIFHRCVDERLYTAPCGRGTYFSTQTCACSHIDDVIREKSCNTDGLRLEGGNDKKLCTDSTGR